MLPNQTSIKNYNIYTYTFLDDLSFIKDPHEYFEHETKETIENAIVLVGEKFKEHGWEGDGSIGIIWLPPFIEEGIEDTWGTYVWHVKQNNDGISFIASYEPLNTKRLGQNEFGLSSVPGRTLTPISIIETDVEWFLKAIDGVENNLKESIEFLAITSSHGVTETIKANTNIHYQSVLVRYFQEFLDECYLQILIDAIENGNPHKIKLRKSQIKIDLASHMPEPDDEEDDIVDTALTIRFFIGDMWKAYKWEPFKTKMDMLFKSIDYNLDSTFSYEIRKHVIIRNCMQHHEGSLDQDSLKQLGRQSIEMKCAGGIYHIKVWKPLKIEAEEIYSLCDLLKKFVEDFHRHIKRRVPTVHYISRKTQPET